MIHYLLFLDEVHCLENLSPPEESYLVTDLFVIFLVLSLLVAMIVILVLAVNKYSGKTAKFESRGSIGDRDLFSEHQLLEPCDRGQEASYSPSCPPAPPSPPPAPFPPPLPTLPASPCLRGGRGVPMCRWSKRHSK